MNLLPDFFVKFGKFYNRMSTGLQTKPQNSLTPIIVIGSLFFIFGFVTWLNALLIPYLQIACELSEFQAYFVTTAFYIAYLVMAPVSTRVLNKFGFKKGMSVGLVVMAVGALLFIPAAYTRTYAIFLIGLFIIGAGLAILQTASNPYITIIGPVETAARRISIMGICNKMAGALAPIIMGYFLNLNEADKITQKISTLSIDEKEAALSQLALQVVNPYIGIVVVLLILAYGLSKTSLPEVNTDEEKVVADGSSEKKSAWAFPHVVLGFITLFLYVGVEVIAGDTIISYGKSIGVPLSEAKFFTGFTMIAMVVGYIIGIITIPKIMTQETALKLFSSLGILFTFGIVFTSGMTSLYCVALLGLANSLIWPAIWPLTLKGVGKFTGAVSGILVMGIAGGAVLPPLYGKLSQFIGAHQAYWIALPCYLFILYYAIAGHKVGKKA